MKTKFILLAGAVLASSVALSSRAQFNTTPKPPETVASKRTMSPGDPSPTPLGLSKAFDEFTKIQIKNLQGDSLGRIKDVGIDLINGRVVEVLVECDASLEVGKKIVAVPPLALVPDQVNLVYQLDVSVAVFKTAAAIDLKKWDDSGRSDRIAAAYHLFGQETYFLEEGDVASKTAERPKVRIGYVERSTKIMELPVGNFQHEKFGKVWSMTLDIPKGRIMNVIVIAPGNFETKSVVPAMALSFNAERNGLVIDDTKAEFADEPRYLFKAAAYGHDASSKEEAYKGPHTFVALEQGSSYPDMDRTVLIHKNIRTAKINGRNVEVGTMDGRVTLRGWVNTEDDKRRIGEIAIAASRLELVDNQIVVGRPLTSN